ncbi:hypothetical protein NKJ91_30215 [Mesorhizobium sp. M0040]
MPQRIKVVDHANVGAVGNSFEVYLLDIRRGMVDGLRIIFADARDVQHSTASRNETILGIATDIGKEQAAIAAVQCLKSRMGKPT